MAIRPYQAHDVTLPAGHNLRYYEWPGSGPNLVLLHGSSSYGLQWEWVADNLSDRFHVFALDQRGHGDSGRPDGEYSAEEYAEDVHQFVDTLGLGSIVIGGNSLGGRVSQVFAAEYPEQCVAVILAAVHLSNFYHDRQRMAAVLESACTTLHSPTEFASREEAVAFLKGSRGDRETEASLNHRIEHNMHRVGNGYRVKYDTVRVAQGLTHMAKDLRAYAARVSCPVLILRSTVGSELSSEQGAEVASLWQNGRVVDVESGYMLHLQNPVGTAAAMNAFIDSATGAAGAYSSVHARSGPQSRPADD
ncbi:MAG: alpha/beta hydrolase [Chloroflexi bacterium]|nr:alpha/beta hydrolase [Chloroflexota bacterium]